MQDRRRFLKNTAAAATSTTLFPALAGSGCTPATEQSEQEHPQKTRHLEQRRRRPGRRGARVGQRRPHWPKRFDTVDQYLALRLNDLKGTHVNGMAHCGLATIPHWEVPRKNIRGAGSRPGPARREIRSRQRHGVLLLHPHERCPLRRLLGDPILDPAQAGKPASPPVPNQPRTIPGDIPALDQGGVSGPPP